MVTRSVNKIYDHIRVGHIIEVVLSSQTAFSVFIHGSENWVSVFSGSRINGSRITGILLESGFEEYKF